MKLLRLRLKNFRSFRETQEFTFPDGPGLYYLTGDNQVNPRLGANGTGKSTLWEALTWLWFDKTSKGLRAGDVSSWSIQKGTQVELDYEADGVSWTLGRTWSPNKWYLIGPSGEELLTSDNSNIALDHLGMAFLPFQHSILMAQGQPMFLDMKPEAASSLFSEIMDLDHWLDLSTKAGKQASAQDMKSRTVERELSKIRGQLEELSSSDLKQTAEEWEDHKRERLDLLEEDYKKHLAEYDRILADTKPVSDRVNKLKEDLSEARANLGRCDDHTISEAETRLNQLKRTEAVLLRDREQLNAQGAFLERNDQCEHCGQSIPLDVTNRKLGEVADAVEKVEDDLFDVRKDVGSLELSLDGLRGQMKVWSDLIKTAERNLQFAQLDLRSLDGKLAQEEKVLDRLEEMEEQLSSQVNPVTKALRDLERRRRDLLADLSQAEKDLSESERLVRLYQFWVRGFKDIRLDQVSEALTQLEIEVNSCVTQLGLTGWSLLFDPDSETKGGKIKRGFSVKVLSPDNDKPVPWAAWSGGEAQRLRVAGNMGLANLIRDRMGITLPLEVWDEPTQGLSSQGVSDLLGSLAQRALSEHRQIWIVDHRSPGFGHFDGTVTVVKNRKGSNFDQSACIYPTGNPTRRRKAPK